MDTVKCHYASKRLRKALVFLSILYFTGFPGGSVNKESTCNAGDWILSLSWADPLEEGMAPHSSILAWKVSWIEELGGPQFMGS